jgi:hypothetical protein
MNMNEILAQPIDQSGYVNVNLDVGTWQWLQASFWVAAVLVIAVLVLLVYIIVYRYRTPKEASDIRSGSHKKTAGVILVGDDGYADYEPFAYTGAEGWGETKSRGKPKQHYTGFLPRPGLASAETIDADKQENTEKLANFINTLNTRKLFWRGAKTSLWVAVKPKAILANIWAIAGIQIAEEFEKFWNDWRKDKGEIFLVDVTALKRMVVSSSWNESQINALEANREALGELKAADKGIINKWAIIGGIGLAALGFACLIISIFV